MIYIVKEVRQFISIGEHNGEAGNGGEGRQNGKESAMAKGTLSRSTLLASIGMTGVATGLSAMSGKLYNPVTGESAPASAPYFIGQEYIDTSAKAAYKACGTDIGDWKPITAI